MAGFVVAIAGLLVTVARDCSGLLSQCYRDCFAGLLGLLGLLGNIGVGCARVCQ